MDPLRISTVISRPWLAADCCTNNHAFFPLFSKHFFLLLSFLIFIYLFIIINLHTQYLLYTYAYISIISINSLFQSNSKKYKIISMISLMCSLKVSRLLRNNCLGDSSAGRPKEIDWWLGWPKWFVTNNQSSCFMLANSCHDQDCQNGSRSESNEKMNFSDICLLGDCTIFTPTWEHFKPRTSDINKVIWVLNCPDGRVVQGVVTDFSLALITAMVRTPIRACEEVASDLRLSKGLAGYYQLPSPLTTVILLVLWL